LKGALEGLAKYLFGSNVEFRWTDAYFPFTHPSWELEIFNESNGDWLEILGCGILEQQILINAGASQKVGWAFGLVMERLAMKLYQIPDIRLFWSEDSGFLHQFDTPNFMKNILFKSISRYPQLINDISFWLPKSGSAEFSPKSGESAEFSPNDFYDLVRTIGGDLVEQVFLFDEFSNPKTGKKSHAYRIIYRHMEKTLTQEEISVIHKQIERETAKNLGVEIR